MIWCFSKRMVFLLFFAATDLFFFTGTDDLCLAVTDDDLCFATADEVAITHKPDAATSKEQLTQKSVAA